MMFRNLGVGFVLTMLAACSAGSTADGGGSPNGGGNAGGQGGQGAGGSPSSSGGGGEGAGFEAGGGDGVGGGIICDPGGPDDDVDQDGYTPNQGDCEDCDPNRNPNAIEVPTDEGDMPYDENCDEQIDEAQPPPCDAGIEIDEMDPLKAADAVGLCKRSAGVDDWGVVSAEWVMADGSPPPTDPGDLLSFHLGHGFLDDFGPNVDVREGERLLILSSGAARRPEDPGYEDVNGFDKQYVGDFEVGFPKESPSCPGTITGEVHDPVGVEIVIRTPSNATGFSFDFDFYTYEWPNFVCNSYNDFFIAILEPYPPGQTDGNVSYDGLGNPISVNNALLNVCGCEGNPPSPCSAGPLTYACPFGNTALIGTGFGFDTTIDGSNHAATGWLRTTAPVEGGSEVHLRFAVHDSQDGVLDSTSLVDNFKWVAKPGTMVGTNPVPQ